MYNSIINPNGRCGKIKKLILFIILTVAVSLPCYAKEPQVRGVWVSTVYNLDYPSEAGISPAQMMHEADEIITSAARAGINTIFLQVRPCCDAIYPSEIFPFSQYISGVQGQQPEGGFDPLDYFIDRCHEMGIELHAWVNPYRVTVSRFTSIEEGLATLSPAHPARLHPQWVRLGKDGRLYFDPALPEVLELITDGVREILDNYDVDGIHLDDYFYPDGGLDDSGSFELYGGGFDNIGDFRRDNVDRAVKSLHQLAEEYNTTFGISPFGIWANRMSNLSGSNTIGGQSYYDHYADTLKWIKEGWLGKLDYPAYLLAHRGVVTGAIDPLIRANMEKMDQSLSYLDSVCLWVTNDLSLEEYDQALCTVMLHGDSGEETTQEFWFTTDETKVTHADPFAGKDFSYATLDNNNWGFWYFPENNTGEELSLEGWY